MRASPGRAVSSIFWKRAVCSSAHATRTVSHPLVESCATEKPSAPGRVLCIAMPNASSKDPIVMNKGGQTPPGLPPHGTRRRIQRPGADSSWPRDLETSAPFQTIMPPETIPRDQQLDYRGLPLTKAHLVLIHTPAAVEIFAVGTCLNMRQGLRSPGSVGKSPGAMLVRALSREEWFESGLYRAAVDVQTSCRFLNIQSLGVND